MLTPEMQEYLKKQAHYADPESQAQTRQFDYPLSFYKSHVDFLNECGHDTFQLVSAIERVRASIQDLREVNNYAAAQFKLNPFPSEGKELGE